MPEPHSTTIGLAIGAGIGLTGTVLGAQVDALIVGLCAATLISFCMPAIDNKRKAAASVAITSLVAGYWSPSVAGWLAENIAALGAASALRLPVALILGVAGPTIGPSIISLAKRKVESQSYEKGVRNGD
jgi:hypothetical protein